MRSQFLSEKAQQALLYVAGKLPEHRNMYKVLKVIYFADKQHLFDYGRFIFGDSYIAMQHGPVPSGAYNMVKRVKLEHARPDCECDGALFTVREDDTIEPLVQPDLLCFSKSDLECLDKAIEECRPLTFGQLKSRSHDEAYNAADDNDIISIESIAAMAPSGQSEALLDYIETYNVHG
ncbi:MAG: Panacea domain-containing protein [Acidiferrobacterales bacterium]